ncbi:unnamed protein product [Rotaria magnacalcarata]|uniref:Uncharacterized protein n=1 Tax=Rotaria magnacalcarata TaxID=392030 RepID=A0A816SUJ3_9BILA|nr:unnamed protein product [Rotaria magnacalcarata]CAF2272631.1 unnamed protein product [Rotaria magnacalcarata]CAF3774179.1 unnamed protein product [Rotaria magnacalcarata]
MAIRQQYANEELVHKLRSMLNDLPTLRTRAIKKLEHWREAAIKRLLARQRELEKTLLDKFERLESDTQLFVEKTERKKAQQQRRWQSEPLDFLNKNEIDRISTNLRSIRQELEQSKLILAGNLVNENIDEIISDVHSQDKLTEASRYGDTSSSKTAIYKNYDTSSTTSDFGFELKRVLEICTSPQSLSSTLSADEQSRLQFLNHTECSHDAKSKQTAPKTSKTSHQKRTNQTNNNANNINNINNINNTNNANSTNRRHARLITDITNEHEQQEQPEQEQQKQQNIPEELPVKKSHQLFAYESFDDSIRRVQRLREIRSNLRTIYDDNTPTETKDAEIQHSKDNSSKKIDPSQTKNPDIVQLYDQAAKSVKSRDRKYRSRTLEGHQMRAVDNQMYGCSSSKAKQQVQYRSESHKDRNHRLSFRRSSEDFQDKKLHLRRHLNSSNHSINETWFEIEREHWANLLENGWRPMEGAPGVNVVSFDDPDDSESFKHTDGNKENKMIDLYEQISRNEYVSLFENLDFAYTSTVDLGNEFWRFLEINGNQHLCLYHQLNKQFIMYKPDVSLLSFPWPYDGIVDISWSKATNAWAVATQTQIIICNHSFSKVLQSIDINGDWPKRITSCRSSVFHTYKLPQSSIASPYTSSYVRLSHKDRPQFLLERYDYKLNSLYKHILESSTIWDIEADDLTEHLAVLCDVALLIFDYQLNLLRQIEVTGFKVSTDHFGGWLIADYNASCIWQIRRNEYLKANKIVNVERPWSVILDRSMWTLVTLSETQNRAKRLLFFSLKNIPSLLTSNDLSLAQSQLSSSSLSSLSESVL